MNIYLFNITKDKRVVDKNVKTSDGDEYENVIVKDSTSLMNPTFILSGFDITEIPAFNYLYFPKMARYYFVNNVNMMTGKRIEIDCSIDVLQSFRKDIKSWSPIIARQEKLVNNEIPDAQLPLYSKQIVSHKTIGSLPSGNSIVLTTTGRSGTDE